MAPGRPDEASTSAPDLGPGTYAAGDRIVFGGSSSSRNYDEEDHHDRELLEATLSIRPLTIRFTEAGVSDLELRLFGPPSVVRHHDHKQDHQSSKGGESTLLFDYDSLERPASESRTNVKEANEAAKAAIRILQTMMLRHSTQPHTSSSSSSSPTSPPSTRTAAAVTGRTVRRIKQRIRAQSPNLATRKLRLIHAGRILPDQIDLFGLLQSLDSRFQQQQKQQSRLGAEDDDEDDDDDEYEDDDDAETKFKDQLVRSPRNLTFGELVQEVQAITTDSRNGDDLKDTGSTLFAISNSTSEANTKGKGKQRQLDTDPATAATATDVYIQEAMSKEEWLQRFRFHLTQVVSPRVYVQCSVGDVFSAAEAAAEAEASSADQSEQHKVETYPNSSGLDGPEPGSSSSLATGEGGEDGVGDGRRRRGFDRLTEIAGLDGDEIASIRATFLRRALPENGVTISGDLLRLEEERERMLEFEERWMEDSVLPSAGGLHQNVFAGTTTTTAGAIGELGDETNSRMGYVTALQGLMLGFFMPPLIPLFWFKDKACHPSAFPTLPTQSQSQSQPTNNNNNDEEEEDDEQEAQNFDTSLSTNIVFSQPMQISILFGIVANLLIGAFRLIW